MIARESWRFQTTTKRSFWALGNPSLVLAVFRFALLSVSTALVVATDNFVRVWPAVLAMATLAIIASVPSQFFRSAPGGVTEAIAATAIATIPEPASGNLMLCLLGPALAVGLRGGYRYVLSTAGASALVGSALILVNPSAFDAGSLVELFRWVLLAMALGLMVAWYQVQRESDDSATRSYAQAVRVLTELESISRRLPTGLDVGTIATQSLMEAVTTGRAQAGVLVAIDASGQLKSEAHHPESVSDPLHEQDVWEPWSTQASMGECVQRRTPQGVEVMVPMLVDGRLAAFVLLAADQPLDRRQLNNLAEAMERNAFALEAAVLFSSIRDIASNEERNRIAREIHDGIAQDIAFLGYTADEIVDGADDPDIRRLATALRTEITRVVGELRMSVFSLREGVSPSDSLGGALGTHARRVFQGTEVQMHLAIEESPHRLRPEVESELLRMGKEALTNARRHADATNVWLTCLVDAPRARLLIEDDGRGLGSKRADSFGLDIMRERASRIQARLEVHERAGGGTTVSITT